MLARHERAALSLAWRSMPVPLSPPPSQHQIERLLSSLAGVVSARVLLDYEGRIRELHVLATPELHPKQVVRNVESALSAGLGVEVDRRVVSVAQIEGLQPEPAAVVPVEDETSAAADAMRVVLVGFDSTRASAQRAHCTVTLERGGIRYSGAADGADTPQGRAEAAAEAVLHAVGSMPGGTSLGFEGARVVETDGRRYVLVAARVMDRRPPLPLSGAALLDRTPEEAGIMAALQATNRWSTGDR
jgi:hypothetical protein